MMKLIALAGVALACAAPAYALDRNAEIDSTIKMAQSLTPAEGQPVVDMAETVCPIVKQTGETYLPQIISTRVGFSVKQTTFLIQMCTLYVMGVSVKEMKARLSQ